MNEAPKFAVSCNKLPELTPHARMRCTRACSLPGILPNTPISVLVDQQHHLNHSIYDTKNKIEEIQDRLRRGFIAEEQALSETAPLESLLAMQTTSLAHYVDTLIDPVCRISITFLENCDGCPTRQTQACDRMLTHSSMFQDIGPSMFDSADEGSQGLVFEFNATNADSSLRSSRSGTLWHPFVYIESGDVKTCLAKDSYGNVTFSVTLFDDGGTERGGWNAQGPVFLSYTVYPVNQAPSFRICECAGNENEVTRPSCLGVQPLLGDQSCANPVWAKLETDLDMIDTVVERSCQGACCRDVTGCCTSQMEPFLNPSIDTQFWCSSFERTAAPVCNASVYIPRFTEFQGRVMLSIEVEQIDFDAPTEFISSIVIAGQKIGDVFHPKQDNHCGHFSKVLHYEVPLHVYGNQYVSISTSADVNDRFHSQNCNGKSVNARITLSRGYLTNELERSYVVWKTDSVQRSHHVHERFAWDVVLGERSADGSDIEASQSFTFTVIPSPSAAHLFSSMPVLHANGTLEWALLVNRTGQANLTILMHDDGFSQDLAAGTLHYAAAHALSYAGVNVSAPAHVSVVVAATYAIVRFDDLNLTLHPHEFMESARRIIAAGEGLPLSRVVVLPQHIASMPVPNASVSCAGIASSALCYCSGCNMTNSPCNRDCAAISNASVCGRASPDAIGSPWCPERIKEAAFAQCISVCQENAFTRSEQALGLQIVGINLTEALRFAKHAAEYSEWLQALSPGVNVSVKAFVKNWDNEPFFNVTRNVFTVLGLEHPSSAGLVVPNFIDSVIYPPDTLLDVFGQQTVIYDFMPLRHRGVQGGEWLDGTDGQIGIPGILTNCGSSCEASSSSAESSASAHCMPVECFNGSLQFNQTGLGYGEAEYQISMRTSPPTSYNFMTCLPVYRLRIVSLLDLQVQRILPIILYEAKTNHARRYEEHVIVFGMPHRHRRQNASFEVISTDPSLSNAMFSSLPALSEDGTLTFMLEPGAYGNASFVLRVSTSDQDVYGLCATHNFVQREEGGQVHQTCVTSRKYTGIRPDDEDSILEDRPFSDYVTTNFTIAVLPVNNAPFFQLNCSARQHRVECAGSCANRTTRCNATVSLSENNADAKMPDASLPTLACKHPVQLEHFIDSGNLRPSEKRFQNEYKQSLSFSVQKVRVLLSRSACFVLYP